MAIGAVALPSGRAVVGRVEVAGDTIVWETLRGGGL